MEYEPWQEHILKPREYIPETNETTTVAMDVTEDATTTEDAAAALKVARAEDSMARYAISLSVCYKDLPLSDWAPCLWPWSSC